MQTVTESLLPAKRESNTENLVTQVRYLGPDGGLTEMLLNLGNHEGRVKLTRTVIWAMRNNVELRITRI
jgi:hypothetical protein